MVRKIIIACFVLAGLLSGCQEQISSAPAVEIERHSVEPAPTASPCPCLKQASSDSDTNSPTVIAYYFHRTMRCHTCLAIETNAARVVENNFSQQMTDGRLTWIPYNLDDAEGEDLAKEFDISASTLVLAKIQGSDRVKYKKLDRVWSLIGDPDKFNGYIVFELNQFLNE